MCAKTRANTDREHVTMSDGMKNIHYTFMLYIKDEAQCAQIRAEWIRRRAVPASYLMHSAHETRLIYTRRMRSRARISGGTGDVPPPHWVSLSSLLFVFLASPRGTENGPGTAGASALTADAQISTAVVTLQGMKEGSGTTAGDFIKV